MSKAQSNLPFKWMLIIASVLLVPVLLSLGFWQLDRADQKRQLKQSWTEQKTLSQLPPLSQFQSIQYLQLELKGFLDTQRFFLLDNRIRDGRVGYEVIVPFKTPLGELLVANLGWVAAGSNRALLPKVEVPDGKVLINGGARLISPAFSLGPLTENNIWPVRIQQLNAEHMGKLLNKQILPVEVRIKQPVIPALNIEWPIAVMPPQKHLAYAVQWFVMALALVVLLIWSWRQVQREVAHE
ncbi:MAG: SURF1 family protein [Neptuniibacter sp.]